MSMRDELSTRAATDPGPGLSFSPRRAGFWAVTVCAGAFASLMNALSTTRDLARAEVPFRGWEPYAWEGTSMVATLALVPGLIWFVERRPWSNGPRLVTFAIYACASVAFSALHVAGMVLLRKAIYLGDGSSYVFGDLPAEFVYELRKDVVSFFLLMTILNLLREVERRLTAPLLVRPQELTASPTPTPTPEAGEAEPPAPGPEAASEPASRRITIRDGAKEIDLTPETLVAVRAAGNYVEVFRTAGEPLMLRATLADAEESLAPAGLLRVHRSWLVAVAHVERITPSGGGDFRARLRNGMEAPVSRRYKDAIRNAPGMAREA